MSEHALARIWIGGRLKRSESYRLILSVKRACVSAGIKRFEHLLAEPKSIEGMMDNLTSEGHLHYQHPEGELDSIMKLCRQLGLTYRLWRSTSGGGVPLVEFWEPGMPHPVRMLGHVHDPGVELVDASVVRRAIELLEHNRPGFAKATLQSACPDIPEVPPLELVED